MKAIRGKHSENDSAKCESLGSMNSCSPSSAGKDEEEVFYDFQLFISQMKDQRADPIVRYTRSFLHSFVTKKNFWTAEEQVKLVNDFKLFIYDKFLEFEPFKSLDRSKLHNAQEGMEKLLMGKLYNKCFSPLLANDYENLTDDHRSDLVHDANLMDKILEFRFIKPINLEIPATISPKVEKFIQLSGKELNRINSYKAPRDKMVCILNACKVIYGFLKHSKLENEGADVFIPMLIYTIMKANVRSLVSNVIYIERFRFPEYLRGESGYYLSSLHGAINFILHMGEDSLFIPDKSEYNNQYEQNSVQVAEERDRIEIKEVNLEVPKLRSKSPSPSEYILKPLDGATNTVISKFAELFSPTATGQDDTDNREHQSAFIDDETAAAIAHQMEEDDHVRTIKDLQAMFPEMGCEIIQDVCAAKRYRIGACVDALLTLSS